MIERIEVKGEVVYLKRNSWLGGYRVVNPIKNDDGSINYFRLFIGSWANLFKTVIILAAIFILLYSYMHDTAACRELLTKSPQQLCGSLFNSSIFLPDGSTPGRLNLSSVVIK